MAIYSFEGITPVVHPTAYIHPQASIIGDVWIHAGCYVGPFASLRGDFNRIVMEQGSNIQDSCCIHGYSGHDCIIEKNAHLGHGSIVHSAVIRSNVMVGMQALIMDFVEVGENSIIGAQSLVTSNQTIPPNSLFIGAPGKVVKTLSDTTIQNKSQATSYYHELAIRSNNSLRELNHHEVIEFDNATEQRHKLRTQWPHLAIFKVDKNNA